MTASSVEASFKEKLYLVPMYRSALIFLSLLLSASPLHARCNPSTRLQQKEGRPYSAYSKFIEEKNQEEWHDTVYWSIGSDTSEEWISLLQGHTPIYPPFQDPLVRIAHTFAEPIGDDTHQAIDYIRSDQKTFSTHAIADGTVLFVGYHSGPGNVVIIEHHPIDGPAFRSIYHHLRGGRDHDIALALRTQEFVEKAEEWNFDTPAQRWQNSAEQAVKDLEAGTHLERVESIFGTNEQIILVKEGQTVRAGQQIGWAGCSGSETTHTHLHLMVAQKAPNDHWTFFDPYGLYGDDAELHAYILDDGQRSRSQHLNIFSPTPADFTDVPLATYRKAFRHYARFNYFPRCLAAHQHNGKSHLSGSFSYHKEQPVVRTQRSQNETNLDLQEWGSRNWYPSHLTATTNGKEPSFICIYERPSSPINEVALKLNSEALLRSYGKMHPGGYILENIAPFKENGALWFATTWTKPKAKPSWALKIDTEEAELAPLIASYEAKGFYLHRLVTYEKEAKQLYGLLFQEDKQPSRYAIGLSNTELEVKIQQMREEDFSLIHLCSSDTGHCALFRHENLPHLQRAITPLMTKAELKSRWNLASLPPIGKELEYSKTDITILDEKSDPQLLTIEEEQNSSKTEQYTTIEELIRSEDLLEELESDLENHYSLAYPDPLLSNDSLTSQIPTTPILFDSKEKNNLLYKIEQKDLQINECAITAIERELQNIEQDELVKSTAQTTEAMPTIVDLDAKSLLFRSQIDRGIIDIGYTKKQQGLLWKIGEQSGELTLVLNLPYKGLWRLEGLVTTKRPGTFQVFHNNLSLGGSLQLKGAVQKSSFGEAMLEEGDNTLRIRIRGNKKEPYNIFFDHLRFVYLGPNETVNN